MNTTRKLTRPFLGALLVAATVAAAGRAAPPGASQDKLLPGAKLLHTFPQEVYRVPALVTTEKGLRLLVWVDESDPNPTQRIPGIPLPDPVYDLIVWDASAGKEMYKVSFPKEGAPHPPVTDNRSPATVTVPCGAVAVSPDGKQLAGFTYSYKRVPGKLEQERLTEVRIFDPDNRKWQPVTQPEVIAFNPPSLLFAPDGSLVVLKESSYRVFEPGKAKARVSFDLERSPAARTDPVNNAIRDAVVSPDGSQLAVAADGTVVVYDLTTGKKVFRAERAAPEPRRGAAGQNPAQAALAFAPSAAEPKLLAVETVVGPPKSFVLARVFDLKDKKQAGRRVLVEQATKANDFSGPGLPTYSRAYPFFTSKGEARVVFDGKLINAADGKVLDKFDARGGMLVSRDGKYLVRMVRSTKDEKKIGIELWGLEGDK
jgi:hypothetical protein